MSFSFFNRRDSFVHNSHAFCSYMLIKDFHFHFFLSNIWNLREVNEVDPLKHDQEDLDVWPPNVNLTNVEAAN